MIYGSKDNRKDYFPPLLGNGDIALYSDCEGSVASSGLSAHEGSAKPGFLIYRAGRRKSVNPETSPMAFLLNFGTLKFDMNQKLSEFTHELNTSSGYASSECTYENGGKINTKCFVHPSFNLYGIKKCFKEDFENAKLTLGLNNDLMDYVVSSAFEKCENGISIDLSIRAYENYSARILLFSDKKCDVQKSENNVTLNFSAKKGEEICFYYALEDTIFDENFKQTLDSIKEKALSGFETVSTDAEEIWNDYHKTGFVKTGNEILDNAYETAMYHLRCITTRWSIPVGINEKFWNGNFFGFDEYYSYHSLLEAGKTELAKRVPTFRISVLDKAIRRATDYSKNPDVVQARYPWQTGEHGEELTRTGFWQDHIFHMAVIAVGAFEYFEYTNDTEFLKACLPMIKACAKFYTLNSIYEDINGDLYVGKCTDLERLGSSVENPFFTSCGVIKTLECYSKASAILGENDEYAKECLEKAEKLRKTLPHDGEKYVPFKGCTQKSIAVCTGKYPFDVLDNNDEKLLPALMDFVKYETTYGNMYPVGKKLSIWYASWKSCAFARMNRADDAYRGILQALESVGVFCESFEINEDTEVYRPWFSTAAGVLSTAISEMLINSDGENVYLLPATPDFMKDVSFKLMVKGGAVADVEIENNKIKKLEFSFLPTATPKKFNVYLRGEKCSL